MYVLPYGQMSIWGEILPYMYLNSYFDILNGIILTTKIRSYKRIGPHNIDILSIIFGSLLGDGYAEKHGNGTRICFYQEGSHKGYLLWLYKLISNLGYVNIEIPKLTQRLGKFGKLRFVIIFKTYTYSNLNWVHNIWYKNEIKILPSIELLNIYLTPLALSIWIMNDGSISSSGMKLSTNKFTLNEVKILSYILNNKYNISTTVIKAGLPDQYIIYISKNDKLKLWNIVGHHIHPSMKYKFNL